MVGAGSGLPECPLNSLFFSVSPRVSLISWGASSPSPFPALPHLVKLLCQSLNLPDLVKLLFIQVPPPFPELDGLEQPALSPFPSVHLCGFL